MSFELLELTPHEEPGSPSASRRPELETALAFPAIPEGHRLDPCERHAAGIEEIVGLLRSELAR